MTRLFVVEDHAVMREMLEEFIRLEADMVVMGFSSTGESALERIDDDVPDLVLLDIALPDMSGIVLATRLRQRHPDLPIVMLSGHAERSYVDKAFAAGASGYILKGHAEDIPSAVREVLEGRRFLSPVLGPLK